MAKLNTADTMNAISEGLDSMTPNPIKRGTKAAAKAPAKKAAKPVAKVVAPKAEKPVKVVPVAVMFHGFEVNADADVTVLQNATDAAIRAFESIKANDAGLLEAYLDLGGFLSEVSASFKSPKLFGQFVAKEVPASQSLDPALRSNCKWLWEALNMADHPAADILAILGVNRIADFKSANPTVIRREYNTIVNGQKAKDAAKEAGFDDTEEGIEALAAKEKADKEEAARLAILATAWAVEQLNALPTAKRKAALVANLIPALIGSKDAREKIVALMVEDYLDAMESKDAEEESEAE